MVVERLERERLIDLVLSRKTGIGGREVCQVCGKLEDFTGWAAAIGTHWANEFVPFTHDHFQPLDGGYGPRAFAQLKQLLDVQPHRYCEVCLQRTPREDAQRVSTYWLCRQCVATHERLSHLARRRYVEARSDSELVAWANALEAQP